jgi:hypothetical protein
MMKITYWGEGREREMYEESLETRVGSEWTRKSYRWSHEFEVNGKKVLSLETRVESGWKESPIAGDKSLKWMDKKGLSLETRVGSEWTRKSYRWRH